MKEIVEEGNLLGQLGKEATEPGNAEKNIKVDKLF
jgi:hypothetical protein